MKKKLFLFLMCAVLVLSIGVVAYAESYTMTYYPGATDSVTNMPSDDNGTGGVAYAVSSAVPLREGYEFISWVLDYGRPKYTVNYVVMPDPVYGSPDDSYVPTDSAEYEAGDTVTVASPLTSKQTTGINSTTGEKRPGTWKFTGWDRDDFPIYKDTTITGEWKFTSKFKYTVHHLDIDDLRRLADDEVYWIDELGEVEAKAKKLTKEFYTAYQKSKYNPVTPEVYENKRPDFLLPNATYARVKNQFIMTVPLTEDDQHIFFFYQRPSAG